MTNTVEIKGMRELKKILRELPTVVSNKLAYGALRRAIMPMRAEAINLAPMRNKGGTLKKSIRIFNDSEANKPTIILAPSSGKNVKYDAWYAHFQEFGTKGFGKRKNFVTRDVNKAAQYNNTSAHVYALKSRKYAGAYKVITGYKKSGAGLPAIRFMSTAFDTKKKEVTDNIRKELSGVVTKYLSTNVPKYRVN